MKKNKYWFDQKSYGYGIVPISWEGWLLTIAFLIFLLGSSQFLFQNALFSREIGGIIFVVLTILAAIFLLFGTKNHQKGKLKWRWGRNK